MTLYQKALSVSRLFVQLDKDIKKFTDKTTLSCISGCGFCCTKPNVKATVLEFLPYAMHSYLMGEAERVYELISERESMVCHLFSFKENDNKAGQCTLYAQRGMTCRLFGFSARRAKADQLQLYTCDLIKGQKPQDFAKAVAYIQHKKQVPVVSDYYQKLRNIDATLASEMLPINEAQLKAIALVLQYYFYRKPPRLKKVA